MNSKDNTSKGIDPEKQLQLLRDQCNVLSPQIYRIYALYLQTLRSILLNSVRNAVLGVITGQVQSYSEFSTIERSKSCQLIVDKLGSKIIKMPLGILIGGLLLVAIGIYGIKLVTTEVNMYSFFKKGNKIRDSLEFLDEKMLGSMDLEFLINVDMKDQEILHQIS